MDKLHKSNPWSEMPCDREDCKLCCTGNEKLWGKCRERNLVYENDCLLCKSDGEMKESRGGGGEEDKTGDLKTKTGEKRKDRERDEREEKRYNRKKLEVKYIGETSRSCFERANEHWQQLENLNVKSHMLKHYAESHQGIELKDMKFEMRVIKTYKTSFERQIGESVKKRDKIIEL